MTGEGTWHGGRRPEADSAGRAVMVGKPFVPVCGGCRAKVPSEVVAMVPK